MELEVKVVGGIDSCFVSLPLSLIQLLQSTRSSSLPQILALELRSPPHTWFVAWSGATSASSAIEVSPQFAECVSLPNHANVQVRAALNVPHASRVIIEPNTEDDWEILELNAELAEDTILSQVRIVYEGMRFPLWLHGHTVITFQVASVFPKNVVVQLMQDTKVAVAPKIRKKSLDSVDKEHTAKMLLRLQDPNGLCSTSTHVKGVELHVGLTSVAFVHPETAKKYSFNMLQLVLIVPRTSQENVNISKTNIMKTGSGSATNEVENVYTDKTEYRQAIVQLMVSESVAEGHVMVAKSLRLYLRASLHSWVYLKAYNIILEKNIPSTSLFPCQFKLIRRKNAVEKDGLEVSHGHNNHIDKKVQAKATSGVFVDTIDWSIQNEVLAALVDESNYKAEEETTNQSQNQRGLQSLVQLWYITQLKAITSISGMEVSSLIMGNKTLLHFEVSCYKLGSNGKVQLAYNPSENNGKATEMLFLLTFDEEYLHNGKLSAYEVALGGGLDNINIVDLKFFERMKLCDPVSFLSIEERTSEDQISSNLSSLGWMEKTADDVINSKSFLGAEGSGKTILARTVAKSLENREDILAHIIFISCSKLSLEKVPVIRQRLANHVTEALNHAPSIVIFDDLDSIISSPDSESQPSISVAGLTDFLVDIMDEYGVIDLARGLPVELPSRSTHLRSEVLGTPNVSSNLVQPSRRLKSKQEKRQKSCGLGPIAFIASIQSLEKIPQSLSSSGRFDFHIKLPAPAASERRAMLKHEIQRRHLQCDDNILLDVAVKCDGYDGYDLEILIDRTVHSAVRRFLPLNASIDVHESPAILREDFSQAMVDFLPVAMRDITKSASDDSRSGWDDVGGLVDIRNAIKEMIELPSKFPKTFAQAPLRLRSNVLLYGPPGCGKTHIVGAVAATSSLRFISVKGPELLNKYIGASEQAVRDIFSKAAAAAPCLLFFDEFDSIAPKRGHDNTGVTDRVVNQFLTELDGVEILTGVFVFAATSRPDLLDAALLRPGRLDRLLFCDFPSWHERLEILAVLSRKLAMAKDIDLATIANMTEGFSGADLQALLSDAQLAAVHDVLDNVDASRPEKTPVITDSLLKLTASKARPSVSEEEKRRLYNIYHQFLDSKRSVAAQSRDTKGKKATLA
ncbi:unnamed protein product [Sphenostylis stenocarpa]|uniref:Peroxisomal ATPase PEX1 n=1 Tax=Sphenostylis stenocarpa TaxID=92480 RepID=A0AA86VIG3_9FABA|nr:unnamed protein product [Sphenostylis stenocarpa]